MPDQQNDTDTDPAPSSTTPDTEGVWLILTSPDYHLVGTDTDRGYASARAKMIAGILAGPIPIAERHDD